MEDSGPVRAEAPAAVRRRGLGDTLRTPGVLLGMLAMLGVGISVMTPGFVPNSSLDQIAPLRWLRSVLKYQVGRVLMVVSLVLLFRAWLLLRPARRPGVDHRLVLALWSLPVLLAPPIFSSDAFLYADQGWIIHSGLDPYQVGLTEAGGPFAMNVHLVWRDTTAIYPPLALWVQYVVTYVTGFHGLLSVVAMRVPALLGVAVIAIFVPKVARRLGADTELAAWFALINPLFLLHFVGGMHNDTWMVALVLVAMWCALRWGHRGMLLGAILVGLGAAFKQPGLIAAFAVAMVPIATSMRRLSLWPRLGRMFVNGLVCLLLAIASYSAVSLATGFEFLGWRHATDIAELTWGMSPASIVEQFVGRIPPLFGSHPNLLPLMARIFTVLSVLGLVYLAWRYFLADRVLPGRVRWHSTEVRADGETEEAGRSWRDHPVRWLAWGFMSIAFSGAGYHVWYLLWGGIYLGMLRYGNRVFRAIIAVVIMFVVVEGGLEYYGLRPIPGYLLGGALAWIFWANSTRLRIVAEQEQETGVREPEPGHRETV